MQPIEVHGVQAQDIPPHELQVQDDPPQDLQLQDPCTADPTDQDRAAADAPDPVSPHDDAADAQLRAERASRNAVELQLLCDAVRSNQGAAPVKHERGSRVRAGRRPGDGLLICCLAAALAAVATLDRRLLPPEQLGQAASQTASMVVTWQGGAVQAGLDWAEDTATRLLRLVVPAAAPDPDAALTAPDPSTAPIADGAEGGAHGGAAPAPVQ